MSGLLSALSTANSGLQAQQFGLQTVGNNIANANTAGYSRVDVTFNETGVSPPLGGGLTADARRATSAFVTAQLNSNGASSAFSDAKSGSLTRLEAVLSPTTSGAASIRSSLTGLSNSFVNLSADASSVPQRQDVLAKLQAVATQFNQAASALTSERGSLNSQVAQVATQATQLASKVAALNSQITSAEASGGEASSLRDQRDQAAQQLIAIIGGQALTDTKGSMTILAAGTAIVAGGKSSTLSVSTNAATGMNDVIATDWQGSKVNVTANVSQGELGALVTMRDGTIPGYQAQLDALATSVSSQMNTVHAAGVGLDGVAGRSLFAAKGGGVVTAANMIVSPDVAGLPNNLAAAQTAASLPADNTNATALAGLDFSAGASALASSVATDAAQNTAASESASDRGAVLTGLQQSAVGVSTDEETVKLVSLQRGYEANAQVIKVVNDMLSTLVGMVR